MAKLIAQALKDDAFRQALLQDPVSAAATAGLKLTEEELAAIRSVDPNLSQEELEQRVSKFWGGGGGGGGFGGGGFHFPGAGLKTVSA